MCDSSDNPSAGAGEVEDRTAEVNGVAKLLTFRGGPSASEIAVQIIETDYTRGGLGWRVWRSARALSQYIACHPEIVAGKRVLELGAGCGLCGLVAGKLGAAEVTISDALPGLLANLRATVALQCAPRPRPPPVLPRPKSHDVLVLEAADEPVDAGPAPLKAPQAPARPVPPMEAHRYDFTMPRAGGECGPSSSAAAGGGARGSPEEGARGSPEEGAGCLVRVRGLWWENDVLPPIYDSDDETDEDDSDNSDRDERKLREMTRVSSSTILHGQIRQQHTMVEEDESIVELYRPAPDLTAHDQYTCIIGSDLLYDCEQINALVKTLWRRMRADCTAYIIVPVRDEATLDKFLHQLEEECLVSEVIDIKEEDMPGQWDIDGPAPDDDSYWVDLKLLKITHELSDDSGDEFD